MDDDLISESACGNSNNSLERNFAFDSIW